MSATRKIGMYDIVELTEPVEDAKAGERGGVVDIFDNRAAMIDITSRPPGSEAFPVVVAPLDRLRVVKPASSSERAA